MVKVFGKFDLIKKEGKNSPPADLDKVKAEQGKPERKTMDRTALSNGGTIKTGHHLSLEEEKDQTQDFNSWLKSKKDDDTFRKPKKRPH